MRLATILTAALLCATAWGWTPSASAATIQVNTDADSIANNGTCSLREAITAANTNKPSGTKLGECLAGNRSPVIDVIRLPAGTYKLKRGRPGEDQNLEGDLDITDSVIIQGVDRATTIVRNAVGHREIRGDGDRIFHADPDPKGGVNLTLRDLTISGGDVGCTGAECSAGASAVDAGGKGPLTLDRCNVELNSFTCSGVGCGARDNAAIRSIAGGSVTIRRSVIKRNRAHCKDELCNAGTAAILMYTSDAPEAAGDFVLERSLVKGNTSTCEGLDCGSDQIVEAEARKVSVQGSVITQNRIECKGPLCDVGDVFVLESETTLTVDAVTLQKNAVSCRGEECGMGGILLARGGTGLEMRALIAEGNSSRCEGMECSMAEQFGIGTQLGNVTIEGLEMTDSVARCTGDGCEVRPLLFLSASDVISLTDSIVSSGLTECFGISCSSAEVIRAGANDITIVRGQLQSNRVSCEGTRCTTSAVHDLYAQAGAVALEDTSIENNGNNCYGEDCNGGGVVALRSAGSNALLERTAFSNNSALCGGVDERCFAAGVLLVYGYEGVDMDTVTLEENLAACGGVGCRIDQLAELYGATGGLDIDDLTIDSNVSECTGRECAASEIFYVGPTGASSIRNASFSENSVKCYEPSCTVGSGGALRNSASALTVYDSSFNQNTSDGFGAAAFNDRGSELILDRVFMAGNVAGRTDPTLGYGGAIYNYGESGSLGILRLINSEIRGNKATRSGGGILNQGAIATLSSTVITGNTPNDCLNVGGTGCP